MFGTQFYPTPFEVAQRMVEPYIDDIKAGAMVLDPSAGRGDLLNAANKYNRDKSRLYAVEIDPDLQSVISGKGYRIIGDDWMQYGGKYHFDLILMNPPFSVGAQHLLRAWDIISDGGKIACLLNSETLQNQYSSARELLGSIIDKYGTVEHLGPCFKYADNQTGVNVSLVRLHKPGNKRFSFTGINTTGPDEKAFEAAISDAPARRDLVGSLVHSFNQVAGYLEQSIIASNMLSAVSCDFWRGYHETEKEKQELASKKGNKISIFVSILVVPSFIPNRLHLLSEVDAVAVIVLGNS